MLAPLQLTVKLLPAIFKRNMKTNPCKTLG